jgi:hypothetical protein
VNDRRVFAVFKAPDEGTYRSCRRDAPQEEQAFDIVDEVRQSDLRLRSRDPAEVNGAGGWFVYTNGKTAPDSAQSDSNVPFDVPNPPQGRFAAATDMNGPGRRILYRDVMVDGRYRLHLTVFYVNAGGFSTLQIDGTIGRQSAVSDRPRDTVSTAHLAGERPSARQHLPWCTRRSKPSRTPRP